MTSSLVSLSSGFCHFDVIHVCFSILHLQTAFATSSSYAMPSVSPHGWQDGVAGRGAQTPPESGSVTSFGSLTSTAPWSDWFN